MTGTLGVGLRGYHGVASRIRNRVYRGLGVQIQGYVWMRSIEIPRNWSAITLEPEVSLDRGVVLLCSGASAPDKLVIRTGTYVNRYTMFDAHLSITVGARCMIGPHCYITDADHGTEPGIPVNEQAMRTAPVVLEDEVWLGAHAVVLAGARIGRGAIVGAGSVVTHDVPEGSVVAGVPARLLRSR